MSDRISSVLLLLSLATASLYIYPSGLPQPADFIMVLFVISVFAKIFLSGASFYDNEVLLFKAWFVLIFWVLLVSIFWALRLSSWNIMMAPLFMVYNFVVIFSVANFIAKERNFIIFRRAICLGLVVSGFGVVISLGFTVRPTGFFNNPNQLAYFSLCSMAALLALYNFKVPFRFFPMMAFLCGILGIVVPASLGAIAGAFLLIIAVVLSSFKSVKSIILTSFVIFFSFSALIYFDGLTGGHIKGNIETRMLRAETKVSDVYDERNYDRIMEFKQYWAFGAGHGEYERFYPFNKNEIHSSFGDMLFSFGFVGLVLFVAVLFFSVWKAPLPFWFTLAAPLLYSITHYGLRSTTFWLAIIAISHSAGFWNDKS